MGWVVTKLKQNYVEDKTNNEMNAIGTFLSNMGYNVTTATMAGRVNDYEETHSNASFVPNENPDISSWVPANIENSVLEELECEDVYTERVIGAKNLLWRNKRCPSCKLGFNAKSKPSKCYGCDSFSHSKPSCFNKGVESPHFTAKFVLLFLKLPQLQKTQVINS